MDEKLSFEIVDEEWASSIQQGLEDYMTSLFDGVFDEDCYADDNPAENTESGISFCGCNVCQYRETLAYVTPRIIDGYLNRKVNLVKE